MILFFFIFTLPYNQMQYHLLPSYWAFYCPSFIKEKTKFQVHRNLCLPQLMHPNCLLQCLVEWVFGIFLLLQCFLFLLPSLTGLTCISVFLKSLPIWSPSLTGISSLSDMAYFTSWHFPCDHSAFLFCFAVVFFHKLFPLLPKPLAVRFALHICKMEMQMPSNRVRLWTGCIQIIQNHLTVLKYY